MSDSIDRTKEEIIQYAMEELIEKGNLVVLKDVFSADYLAHAGEKEYSGHAFIKRFTNQLRTAIPDIKSVDINFLAEESDTIVWQRCLTGTHKVKMQGIPPSGKKLKWVEMVVSRFENEKIVEEWVVSELMGQMLLKVPKT